MEINEVSEIEIKAFIVGSVGQFDRLNLHEKLDELESLEETKDEVFSKVDDAIGLGDAFQIAMNAMHKHKVKVARIVERRVLTVL